MLAYSALPQQRSKDFPALCSIHAITKNCNLKCFAESGDASVELILPLNQVSDCLYPFAVPMQASLQICMKISKFSTSVGLSPGNSNKGTRVTLKGRWHSVY